MNGNFKLDDYVDVAERIREFNAKYPDGSLQSDVTYQETPPGWRAVAWAYRTADDLRPGVGHAFEPVPGKTPYTKDSECMNAETAAWGRAIVALGFQTKKIASRQEVQARQQPANGTTAAKATKQQVDEIETVIALLHTTDTLPEPEVRDGMRKAYGTEVSAELSKQQASDFLARLNEKASKKVAA